MSIRTTVFAVLMCTFTFAACSSPPTAEMDAARSSLASATKADASKHASQSLKEAEAAQAALDAELRAQDAKWIKSYGRARELAVAAKAAADKAATDAATSRERAEVAARERAAARAKLTRAPIRVGGQIRPPVKIKDVTPVYPAVARSARVEGEVVIEATVGEDGKVTDARVVKSIPLLDQAALDAVKQWEYQPPLLNGVPTPVVVTVTINFTRP